MLPEQAPERRRRDGPDDRGPSQGGHPAVNHAVRRERPTPKPAPRYTRALLPVLEAVWLASDQLSGKLLHAILPTLLTALAPNRMQGRAKRCSFDLEG